MILSAGMPDSVRALTDRCLQLAEREKASRITVRIVNAAVKRPAVMQATRSRALDKDAPEVGGSARTTGRLILYVNGQFVREQTLNGQNMMIGRNSRCEFQLRDTMVSRRHAKLVISPDGVTLSDLGSRNGTYVNDRRIDQHMLQDNDVIEIGQCRLDYVVGDNSGASSRS